MASATLPFVRTEPPDGEAGGHACLHIARRCRAAPGENYGYAFFSHIMFKHSRSEGELLFR